MAFGLDLKAERIKEAHFYVFSPDCWAWSEWNDP